MSRAGKALLWAGGAALLGWGGWAAWSNLRIRPEGEAGGKAKTAAARIATLRRSVPVVGRLQPAVKVDVKPEVSGRVARISAGVGDRVKTGDPLVQLDDRVLKTQLEQARIKIDQARLTEDKQRRNLDRRAGLAARDQGLIPPEEMEQAKTDYDLAVVARRDAENAVRNVEEQLQHTLIASPMDGLVIERGVIVGDVVIGSSSAGAPTTLMTVADTRRMQVVVEVNEVDYPEVAEGQAVEFRIPALPGESFKGKVVSVGLSGHPDARNKNLITYTVQAEVTDPSERFFAGMTASADIITQEKEKALVIPREAVVTKDGKPRAIRVADGKETEVVLATGLENEIEVEVLEGLKEGDQVKLGAWTEEDWKAFREELEQRRQGGGQRRRSRGRM